MFNLVNNSNHSAVQLIVGFLLRRPNALSSRTARLAVLALAGVGGGFLIWSSVIHLMLWGDGYRDISVIGPLFLVQGIAGIIVGLAVVAVRSLALLAVGAATGLATAGGLLLSVCVGLFGYTESLSVPYATLSLAVEFTAAFVLLLATAVLALGVPARAAASPKAATAGASVLGTGR